MTRDEIFSKLTVLMRDTFDDGALAPAMSTTSDDVAEWDSANHVLLMVAIEAEFGVRFETDEITAPENVGELVDLIRSKLDG
jgi:acyl carrier protein